MVCGICLEITDSGQFASSPSAFAYGAVHGRRTKTHGPHVLKQNKTEQVKPRGLHESVHLGSHRMYLKIFNLMTIASEK